MKYFCSKKKYLSAIPMQNKNEITPRQRKQIKRVKYNDTTGKYSSKHIRNQEELATWKKKNSVKTGGKSRHIT